MPAEGERERLGECSIAASVTRFCNYANSFAGAKKQAFRSWEMGIVADGGFTLSSPICHYTPAVLSTSGDVRTHTHTVAIFSVLRERVWHASSSGKIQSWLDFSRSLLLEFTLFLFLVTCHPLYVCGKSSEHAIFLFMCFLSYVSYFFPM